MLLLSCFSTSIINHNTIFIKPFVVSIVGSRKVEIGSRKDKVESNSSGLLGTANSSSAARITSYLLLSTSSLVPPAFAGGLVACLCFTAIRPGRQSRAPRHGAGRSLQDPGRNAGRDGRSDPWADGSSGPP